METKLIYINKKHILECPACGAMLYEPGFESKKSTPQIRNKRLTAEENQKIIAGKQAGMSYTEIAQQIGRDEKTIKAAWYNRLAKLITN